MTETFERDIYLLRPDQLSQETIAVTFAKTSRSPSSFREIAEELTDEKSAQFHEKWVVGYGHASVAEHAVLHIAFENISRLAIESIESNRLASYTEKSTRYQKWEPGGYYVPKEVVGTSYEELYRETCEALFAAYADSLDPVRQVIRQEYPQKPEESQGRWDSRIRSKYVDACRFLLPSASFANVGMTVNARSLEHAIRKMLSHPLEEVRSIGEEVKEVSQKEVPTLVKYAEPQKYLVQVQESLVSRADRVEDRGDGDWLELIHWDPQAENRVLAAGLYSRGTFSFTDALRYTGSLNSQKREDLADALLGGLEKFDTPLRELEHATYTLDVLMDQGAYFEVKRHRMMTQTPQPLTTDLGYAVPRIIEEAGYLKAYEAAMESAHQAYQSLARWNPHVASYLVPNAYRRRVLMTMNLREVFHFCELRAGRTAHFSLRRIAHRMAEEIQYVHPLLSGFLRMPEEETWQEIERSFFLRA